ncbi:ABC transporter substrate-binding protein [Paenibacillus lemnae]|uniref:Extracellular solute-binding protein n=1 Tax=Paenibacillus lemnae TaxID=1330551 RepID=A0A848M4D8_PAELE|nr:extracellular solute-binding protein [Paenibacillus lemnae]NMO95101.1 extracellular solute-binding protein [Paenibacillus lemnae]
MRKMKGLSLILFCLIFLLTACSGGGSTAENNTPPAPVENEIKEEVKEPAPEEPAKEEPPAKDLGGRVIKIAAWWDLKPAGATASEKARLDKIAELEKKYNCKIEFVNVPFEEYMNKFTTSVLAGEPFADIVQMEYKAALPAILKGQLLKVSEFTTEQNNINKDADLMTKSPSIGGDEYGFDNPGSLGHGIHYNRDLFKKLGLPDLQELYTNGEWTWDKLLEVAKQATKDTNNDGKTDVWGYSGWAMDVLKHFTAANGGNVVDAVNGKEMLSDAKTIEAAEFVNRLYNVDKVVKVKSGNPMDWEETNTFKDGDVAIFFAAEWMLGDLTFEVGIVPVPNGPQGSPDATYANSGAAAKFIPKGVEDAAIVYQIYEETFDIPQTEEYPSQEYLESMYTNQEDIDMIREHITGTGVITLDDAYPEYPTGAFVDDIIVKNQSVTATAEKYKQQAQASVDKLGK